MLPWAASLRQTAEDCARFNGDVVVQSDGDTSNVFSVTTTETMALRRDPDAPPGSGPSWQTVLTVDGPGPVSMRGAAAIDVTVGFACALTTTQSTFNASRQSWPSMARTIRR